MRIEGRPCCAILDTGSQVTIIFEHYYREHLSHLPLHPLTGLAIWGLGEGQYPYLGYINVFLEFPQDVVGVQQTLETLALVCPSTGSPNHIPCLIGTNAAIFGILARVCRDRAGDNYGRKLKIHALCLDAYIKKERELLQTARGPIGTIQTLGCLPVTPLVPYSWLREKPKSQMMGKIS